MNKDELQKIEVEKHDDSAVTFRGEIPFSYLEKHRRSAVAHLGKDIQIDGFRKGHVPEAELVKHVGEMAVLSEMAERALKEAYPLIVAEHNLDVIGYPEIGITKIAEGNPLGFTAKVAVMPTFSLPEYKKLAAEANKNTPSKEVTDNEVEEQIKEILRRKVAYERLQEKAAKKAASDETKKEDGLGDTTELPTPESVEEKKKKEEELDPENMPLPELTDELVQTLGQPGQFETVEDFRKKIREHLEIGKERDVVSAHRARITDAIIEKTDITLPQVMIDAEINQMFAQMEEDLRRANLNMDDYLKHINKSKEDLRKEWVPAAQKRAKLQLILNEIAKKEDIKPEPEQLEQEVAHLLQHYKDADGSRVRVYVASVLTNEEVMKMLEKC